MKYPKPVRTLIVPKSQRKKRSAGPRAAERRYARDRAGDQIDDRAGRRHQPDRRRRQAIGAALEVGRRQKLRRSADQNTRAAVADPFVQHVRGRVRQHRQ
jgi:hypothetical protein